MFFHTAIDTYSKYNALVVLIVFHVFITDVLSDSLTPNLLNVVQNRHIHFIPHPKRVYYTITTIWSVYCQLSSIMSIYIAFAQIDLCLIRLAADIVANAFTLSMYLNDKVYDAHQYQQRHTDSGSSTTSESGHELMPV